MFVVILFNLEGPNNELNFGAAVPTPPARLAVEPAARRADLAGTATAFACLGGRGERRALRRRAVEHIRPAGAAREDFCACRRALSSRRRWIQRRAPATAHRSRRSRALELLAGGAGYAKARAKTIAGAVVAVALLFAVHAYDRSSTFEPTATVEPIGLATAVVEPAPIMTQEQPAAPTTAGELPHFAALEPADAIPLPPRRPTMIKVSPAHPLKRAVQARK